MFWDLEVMTAGVKLATENLGQQGRIVAEPDNREFLNVSLYSRQAGRFWYGDVVWPAEEANVKKIAQGLKETIYVLPELSVQDTRNIESRALAEVRV